MARTLGLNRRLGGTGAAGWTSYTLPAGGRKAYVSSSTGNDGTAVDNDDTKPYLTVAAACARMRTGLGDWVLFKRGDTWTSEEIGLPTAGASANEPTLWGSYSTGARPLFRCDTGFIVKDSAPSNRGHIAFLDLDISYYLRDPDDPDFNPSSLGTNQTGVTIRNFTDSFLMENCRLRGWGAVSLEIASANQATFIRRNTIGPAFATNDGAGDEHVDGIYYTGSPDAGTTTPPLIEENFFYRNFSETYSDLAFTPWYLHHHIYAQTDIGYGKVQSILLDNWFAKDLAGSQFRAGGTLTNNLFTDSCYAHNIGASPDASVLSYGVMLHQSDRTIDGDSTNAEHGVDVAPADASDITVTNYILANVGTNLGNIRAGRIYTGSVGVRFIDSIIFNYPATILDQGTGSILTGLRIDLNGDNVEYSFPNPTLDLDDYAVLIGLADREALYAAAWANEKNNDNTNYAVLTINNWVRANFGDSSFGAGPPPAAVVVRLRHRKVV